jgi:adenylate kinase
MNIILFGPQGSGKGTQARLLCDEFGFFYFESGEFLRKIAKNNEELKAALDRGELVPDLEMTSYLTAYLDQENLYDDIIFDGFPRTITQYNFLKNWLRDKQVKIDLGIVLEIPEEETLKRLILRKQIEGRGDDNPEAIKHRLALYHQRTQELINEIRKDVEVVEVDGARPIEVISQDLKQILKKFQDDNHEYTH